MLLLEGDVGVGKSRLLQELRCSSLKGRRKQAGNEGQLTMFASGGDPLHRSQVRLPPLTGFVSRACAVFVCQHQGPCGRGPESVAPMVVLVCSWHDA